MRVRAATKMAEQKRACRDSVALLLMPTTTNMETAQRGKREDGGGDDDDDSPARAPASVLRAAGGATRRRARARRGATQRVGPSGRSQEAHSRSTCEPTSKQPDSALVKEGGEGGEEEKLQRTEEARVAENIRWHSPARAPASVLRAAGGAARRRAPAHRGAPQRVRPSGRSQEANSWSRCGLTSKQPYPCSKPLQNVKDLGGRPQGEGSRQRELR